MDGVYERPVECRLCRGPVADGGVWMLELDVEKLRRWWRLALDVELDHDEETLDGLDSILTSCFCQFCLWNARFQSEALKWRDCNWWTGHDSNEFYKKYYFHKRVIQPCSARISTSLHAQERTLQSIKSDVKMRFPAETVNSSNVIVSSSGVRSAGKTTPCIYCTETLPTMRAAFQHVQAAHADRKLLFCLPCQVHFRNHEEEDSHRAKIHNKTKIMCHLCNTRFLESKTEDLKIHVFEKHILKDSLYQCCGKRFRNSLALFLHMTSSKLSLHGVCIYCKKLMLSRNVPKHIIKKHKSKAIRCEFLNCATFFLTKKEQQVHHLEFHKEWHLRRKITCVYCSRQIVPKIMYDHVLIHHQAVAIRCTYNKTCLTYFLTEKEREQHVLKIHMKPKVSSGFKCIYCGITAASIQSLHGHTQQRHKHEKIVCKVRRCFKYFLSNVDLEKHCSEQHARMDIDSVKCDKCEFSTNTDERLRIHIENSHGDRHLQCPHCPKLFGGKRSLRTHICSIHGQKKMCVHCQIPVQYPYEHKKVHPCKFCNETLPCRTLMVAHIKNCDKKPLTLKQKSALRNKLRKERKAKKQKC